ncbi:hypothetical protein PQX77_014776 [Marasmius sp. AFHP31]|nr:hypothetical protein PQX77_014776 [Marasmius sp. AFHP31]
MSLTIQHTPRYAIDNVRSTVPSKAALLKKVLFGWTALSFLSTEEESQLLIPKGPAFVEEGSAYAQHTSAQLITTPSTGYLDCCIIEIYRNSLPNFINWTLNPPLACGAVGFCYAGPRRLSLTTSVIHVAWDPVNLIGQTINLPFSTKLYVRDGLLVWDEIVRFLFRGAIPSRYSTSHHPFTEDVFRSYCIQFDLQRRGPALILTHAPTGRRVSTRFSFGVFHLLFKRFLADVGKDHINQLTGEEICLEVEQRNDLWFLDGEIYAEFCQGSL